MFEVGLTNTKRNAEFGEESKDGMGSEGEVYIHNL
jgi:hypothetical protein